MAYCTSVDAMMNDLVVYKYESYLLSSTGILYPYGIIYYNNVLTYSYILLSATIALSNLVNHRRIMIKIKIISHRPRLYQRENIN